MRQKKSLADWKGIYVTWRNAVEKTPGNKSYLVRKRNEAKHAMRRLEAGVLVCLALFIGGCMTGRGAGTLIKGIGQDVEMLNDGYIKSNKPMVGGR